MKRRACVVAASEMTVRVFLARQLAAMQEHYELTVVVSTADTDLLHRLGVSGTLRPIAIERGITPLRDFLSLWALISLMRGCRFDLVQSMTPKAGLLAMLAAWLARVPVRVHTFTGQVWATRRGLTRIVLRSLDRITARCATFALADSHSQREFLIAEGVAPPPKLAVIGSGSVSGVDAIRFRPDPARRRSVRLHLGVAAHELVLLFVGRLTRDKGVLDLARAFAVLADERPDVRLLVVGPDEQRMQAAMRAICERHVARLHFLDFTDAPEHVMAGADVMCLPSYREGFGSVLIEAAAAGLPAVASRIYGVVDAVHEGQTGLLHEPGDIDGLLVQLRRITGDPALRRSLGETARARAVREFPPSRLTAGILAVLAALLDGHPPSATVMTADVAARVRQPSLAPGNGGGGPARPPGWYRRFGKRLFDLVGASVAIVLLSPLAIVVALLIRVSMGSPVLFRQRRPGLHGIPFGMIKFRSMRDRRDRAGCPLPDGERLTRMGRVLRASSVDEIPELWNVLIGEMSLVGPRPLLVEYLGRYTPRQASRHDIRPGMTGLAQVSGRNALKWELRFELDVEYVERCSLALDLRILALTVWQVLLRVGISQSGRATADEFLGTVSR
jgi:lipopolysaccharide/colanic/teichoic acid biosynthesis glycosyltransferase/glycosyltransferase involved in cell wall biosynthesis